MNSKSDIIDLIRDKIKTAKDNGSYDNFFLEEEKNFNSDYMQQVPFSFFEEDDISSRYGESKDRVEFAKKYFNVSAGWQKLAWDVDAYWTMVAKKVLIPSVLAIHAELVKLGHDEDNSCTWGDADGEIFWMPGKTKKTKVFVHTTQSEDFLYILKENGSSKYEWLPPYEFHIRKIWRKWDTKRNWRKDDLPDLIGDPVSINKILEHVDTLSEYSDDHYKYSSRPSLDLYRKKKFDMNSMYGDCRDSGFIFSLGSAGSSTVRADHTVSKFNYLELITTCYLSSITDQLHLDVPSVIRS